MITNIIIVLFLVYVIYKLWSIVIYLNFKLQVLHRLIMKQSTQEDFNNALDYVLENDYEYKNTISILKKFKKGNRLNSVDTLNFDLDSAINRFNSKFKDIDLK